MDATQRPIQINPEFANYAQEHGIFDMYKVSENCRNNYAKPAHILVKL